MDRAKNINPEILKWARESADLSEEEAAARIGLTSSEKASAAEKLRELEDGEKFPTRGQLLKIASVYRRPLITFYMKEKPRKGERGKISARFPPPSRSAKTRSSTRFCAISAHGRKWSADCWRMRTKQRGFPSWGQQASATARAFTTWPAALQRPSVQSDQAAHGNPDDRFALRTRTENAGCSFCSSVI